MKTLCRTSISLQFLCCSYFVATLLPSVDIYFLVLRSSTSCHCLSSTFFFQHLLYCQSLKDIETHLASEIFVNPNFFSQSHFTSQSPKSFIVSSNSIATLLWRFLTHLLPPLLPHNTYCTLNASDHTIIPSVEVTRSRTLS